MFIFLKFNKIKIYLDILKDFKNIHSKNNLGKVVTPSF